MNVLARVVTARRSVVLVLTVMLAASAAYVGAGVRQSLVSGGFQDPASESVQVNAALARDFGTGVPNVVVIVSGRAGRVSAQDLLRAELLIAPITFILLLLVFGLAIGYSLFIISRFRDELADGAEVGEAVHRTVRTAGLTVMFSALTAAPSLPSLPSVLGHRVNRLDVLSRFRRRSASTSWRRLAMTVRRRPILIATAVVGLLLVLGSPFLSATFSLADDRVLPASAPARQATQVRRLHDRFGLSEPASPAIGAGASRAALREAVASSSSTAMSSAQGRARHHA